MCNYLSSTQKGRLLLLYISYLFIILIEAEIAVLEGQMSLDNYIIRVDNNKFRAENYIFLPLKLLL